MESGAKTTKIMKTFTAFGLECLSKGGLVARSSDGFYAVASTLGGEWVFREWVERPEVSDVGYTLVPSQEFLQDVFLFYDHPGMMKTISRLGCRPMSGQGPEGFSLEGNITFEQRGSDRPLTPLCWAGIGNIRPAPVKPGFVTRHTPNEGWLLTNQDLKVLGVSENETIKAHAPYWVWVKVQLAFL